jgi:hypothetical protein
MLFDQPPPGSSGGSTWNVQPGSWHNAPCPLQSWPTP